MESSSSTRVAVLAGAAALGVSVTAAYAMGWFGLSKGEPAQTHSGKRDNAISYSPEEVGAENHAATSPDAAGVTHPGPLMVALQWCGGQVVVNSCGWLDGRARIFLTAVHSGSRSR